MREAVTTVDFGSSPDKVWGLLTDNENYSWRSDLAEIKIGEKAADFTEVGKDGTETFFSITLRIPHERYELDFHNKNMQGHFIAELHKNNGRTKAVFTEAVEVQGSLKNKIAGFYLRKQQKRYVNDMKKALGEV